MRPRFVSLALSALVVLLGACHQDEPTQPAAAELESRLLASSTGDGFAYVTNQGSNTVSVIDETNTVTGTIPVGTAPVGVAVTPDGAFAYVTNQNSNTVSAIATATNTVTATVPVGNVPSGVAITSTGASAYVTNFHSANVSVIATATNTVTATVPVGNSPFSVAITPDGAFAYVANQGSANVSVIATATNTVTATVPVGASPVGVAITPDGAFAYVTVRNRTVCRPSRPLQTPSPLPSLLSLVRTMERGRQLAGRQTAFQPGEPAAPGNCPSAEGTTAIAAIIVEAVCAPCSRPWESPVL
jgi:YVTN family beta-propeller protein